MEDKMYSKIKNISNGNVVINSLQGLAISKDQEIDLSLLFRNAQLLEAANEIKGLIVLKWLADLGDAAEVRAEGPLTTGGLSPAEFEKKKKEAILRDIEGSSSITALEDYMQSKDVDIAKAAKARSMELYGETEGEEEVPGSNVGVIS